MILVRLDERMTHVVTMQSKSSKTLVSPPSGNNLLDQTPDLIPQSRQVNLQSKDEFGDMLTLGLRMIPKVVKGYRKGIESFTIYGVDMIVYSELWLRNTTTLPLSFGCPSIQIHRNQWAGIVDDAYTDSGKMVAEAALLEIASVLEFGDKGKNLKNKNEELTSKLCQLSFQESSMMIHEVFEYIEMENLIEKRRWWACEDPFIPQVDPLLLNEITAGWHWIDEKWVRPCFHLYYFHESYSLTISTASKISKLIVQDKHRFQMEDGKVVEIYLAQRNTTSMEIEFSARVTPIDVDVGFEGGQLTASTTNPRKDFTVRLTLFTNPCSIPFRRLN